jgi:nifR3 family TIM-barrel protein
MSGVTDLPFRLQAQAFGAGYVVSEMVASEALAQGRADMVRKMAADNVHAPRIIQLAGREARWMAEGARLAEEAGAQVIDINMGCPARQVTRGLSGSVLMRDLDHALGLIDAVIGAVKVPVTVKMRLGWDHDSLNAPELVRRAQDAGAAAFVVHGRTRQQFYKGEADWSAVAAAKAAASVPLVVNGDIHDSAQAAEALELSGTDGVMVGRAAQGRPWLIGEIGRALNGETAAPIPLERKLEALATQLEDSLSLYGAHLGLRMMRKHFASFLDVEGGYWDEAARAEAKAVLCRSDDAPTVLTTLAGLEMRAVRSAA